jgi:hypothetical protein
MVDVATGWIACTGLRDKRQEIVFHDGLVAPTIARGMGVPETCGRSARELLLAYLRDLPRARSSENVLPSAGSSENAACRRTPPVPCAGGLVC